MEPSVQHALRVGCEFGLSVDEVFTEERSSPLDSALAVWPGLVVQRAEDRPAIALSSGVVLARLVLSADKDVELVDATYAPGSSSAPSYSSRSP